MLIKDLSVPGRVLAPGETKRLKCGLVVLRPGESVGEHVTSGREEVIVILEGEATIVDEGDVRQAVVGQAVYISPERRHDVSNRARRILRYLYVVTPV